MRNTAVLGICLGKLAHAHRSGHHLLFRSAELLAELFDQLCTLCQVAGVLMCQPWAAMLIFTPVPGTGGSGAAWATQKLRKFAEDALGLMADVRPTCVLHVHDLFHLSVIAMQSLYKSCLHLCIK
jgi:hypothetical protein